MQNQLTSIIRHSLNAAEAALTALEAVHDEQANQQENCAGECRPQVHVVAIDLSSIDEIETLNEAAEAAERAAKEEAAVQAVAAQADASYTAVMNMLTDSRFRLRTMSEVSAAAGLSATGVVELLAAREVSVVTKTRRSDGARLIGLSARN